jgi:hypothetical protein
MARNLQQPVEIFGVLRIYDRCAMGGCEQHAVAAAPTFIRDDVGVFWLCEEHAVV